jgi:hypothetical protein
MRVTLSPDKFGYYTVGDFKTYSKFEAIELQNSTGQFPEWNFNRPVFDTIDWRINPPVDLWTLYKQRAQQIRDSYDYVVLWYSGGSDSHNVLHACREQGCKIDEIAVTWNYDASHDYQDFQNAEITNVVLPDIREMQKAGMDFKFRLVDISQLSVDLFDSYGLDWEYNINHHFSPNNPVKHILREKIDDYKTMIAAGKRICFVWGIEKPKLFWDGERYYSQFFDTPDNVVGPYVQRKYSEGWYDEFFYWTPDNPLIPIKAAHVLKEFVSTVNDPVYYQDSFTDFGFNRHNGKYLTVDTVKTLIYPRWNPSTFCNGKAPSMIYSIRDQWFLDSNLEQKERFRQITQAYFGKIGTFWANDPRDPSKGIKAHCSPKYYLD